MPFFVRTIRIRSPVLARVSISAQPIRFRSAVAAKQHLAHKAANVQSLRRPAPNKKQLTLATHPPRPLDPALLASTLAKLSTTWNQLPHVVQRLVRFGIPAKHVAPALSAFSSALHANTVLSSIKCEETYISRISHDLADFMNKAQMIDVTLTRLFYEWASSPEGGKALLATHIIDSSTIAIISDLFKAADMSNPASFFPLARSWPKRKIIMHVGPTNSGKTHNALRALAAAESGVYAGPLRLLAHEIWERLNNGQIVPLGMDADEGAEPDLENNIDGGTPFDISKNPEDHSSLTTPTKPFIQKMGNPKFARVCNLITGEEQKIMDESSKLFSCTIEMVMFSTLFDVAVIDEIQMISDPERGGSWTNALLGLNAKEVHICGEESAVPLVLSILKDTGDEVVVNRHQRLSPLSLEEESLEGDLARVREGDCVVAFSRGGIFQTKTDIEKKTGLKCAVAYGRLPPELRSEQARKFNDPNSGYDVIVGSDAIGMGLNLKIKRIIFESVRKWDGIRERYLSISQFKQIAGRAGRYGLLKQSSSDSSQPTPQSLGGFATTLHAPDLPILRKAMKIPIQPLQIARLRAQPEQATVIFEALPPSSRLRSSILFEVHQYVSKMGKDFEVEEISKAVEAMDLIDNIVNEPSQADDDEGVGLTMDDRNLLLLAPTPWRDPLAVEGVAKLVRAYRDEFCVGLDDILKSTGLMDHLDDLSLLMNKTPTSQSGKKKDDVPKIGGHLSEQALIKLESFHKLLVVYLWLSYRNSVAFYQRDEAILLKERVEKVMEWTLQRVSAKAGVFGQENWSRSARGGFGLRTNVGAGHGARQGKAGESSSKKWIAMGYRPGLKTASTRP